MKRTLSQASLPSSASSVNETKRRLTLSRMQLEALAQVALRSGLSKEQVAYEQWVDTQPIDGVVSWEEMCVEERRTWCLEYMPLAEEGGVAEGKCRIESEQMERASEDVVGERGGEGKQERNDEAVGDLGEGSRWRAVRTAGREELATEKSVTEHGESMSVEAGMFLFASLNRTISFLILLVFNLAWLITDNLSAEAHPTKSPSPIAEPSTPPASSPCLPFRPSARVWTATTTEESFIKNKPQCPPCARLKRTWTRCRGGPPCIECQHRGLSAKQCQSYDLLNRSRKNRLKKKVEVEVVVCKKERGDTEEGGIQGEGEGQEEEESSVSRDEDVKDGTEEKAGTGEVVGRAGKGERLDACELIGEERERSLEGEEVAQ